jgi:signal transduction histidine kinase/DNA-binding response OmpR family regulator
MASIDPVAGVFDGPGQVRGLIRKMDWPNTPLGPVRSWSPVLRTMVRAALASSFPMLIHWGPERVALYNDAFAAMLGGKHPDALGRPAKDTWAEAWDRVGQRLDDVIEHGHTMHAEDEQQIMLRNGYPEECYFSFSHSPIDDVDGSVAGVLTVSTETTAKVLHERRMRVVRELGAVSTTDAGNPAETCRAVLRVLATARETMPFAVAFLGLDGGAVEKVAEYGLVPDAAIPGLTGPGPDPAGPIARVLASGNQEEVTGLRAAYPAALQSGPLGPLTPDTAVVLPLTVSGRPDPIGVLVVGVNPYRMLNAEYRAFLTVVARQVRVALSDTVAYEVQRLRSALLADLDRAKMEFFQNVSHELRTPLTVLLAPLRNLLAGSADRPAAEQQDLQAAMRAAERLHTMVDALLDFSGAEVGSLNPDLQPTDLADLTAQTCSMFRAAAEHAGLDFEVEVPDAPLTVAVDRAMWSTIVTNLLSNALKYTTLGGIRVRLTGTGTDALLTVADTGRGIDADAQALVFDRFYRASGNGEEGAGIGLAVVADLVHAHHGRLELQSTVGEGSTFTVTVPLPDTAGHIDSAGATPSPAPSSEGAVRTVLLVEDDRDLRDFLTRLLTRDGWSVHAFGDAESALAATGVSGGLIPDVVLTDVVLPGRDGLELIGQLRQQPATGRSPMIVLTARHGADATAEGLAAGADDYITKPFSAEELLARVHANHELAQLRETAVSRAEARGDQIRAGLESNRAIGTAVGILMANHRLTPGSAFQLLVQASQHSNRKLRDIAADVTITGRLPLRPALADELLIRVAGAPVELTS